MKINETDAYILRLLSDGKTAKEIAAEMGIGRRGVEKRIERIKLKNNIRTKAQLVASFVNSLL